MSRWSRLDTVALAAIVVAAAFVRLASLSRPTELVFDEIFYARDACWYVFGTESACGITDLVSRGHPPLGKWLIGAGIAAFGYEPFGWRVAAAVAGILSIALVYVLARRLLHGFVADERAAVVGAAGSAGLLATDFLHVVQSRVAMLDAFVAMFVLAAVLAIVLDRDRARAGKPAEGERPWWWRLSLGRPWRLVAGASLGAAACVKWSGLYVVPAIVALVIAWEIAEERRLRSSAGWMSSITGAVRREALPSIVLLGIVPVVVYLAGYIGRMPGELVALPWEPGSVWRGIWEHQRAMLEFHTGASPDHPYQSPPWSWPLLRRPVAYWFGDENGTYREIMALGNPAMWWPGLAALAGLFVTWWRAGWGLMRPEPVILAAAIGTYLPWLVFAGSGQAFIWYFLPTVPFLCLALGCFAAWAWQRTAGRVAAISYGLLVVASFAFYVPVLTALPLEPDGWRTRILFADCGRPDGSTQELPDDTTSEGVPPRGWCWI